MDNTVKKPSMEDEEKNALGQKLAMIQRKYPSTALLRDAEVPVSVTVWEPLKKGAKSGYLTEIDGAIEKIDFQQNQIVVSGNRIKLGAIVQLIVPDEFEYSDGYSDDYSDSYSDSDSDNYTNPNEDYTPYPQRRPYGDFSRRTGEYEDYSDVSYEDYSDYGSSSVGYYPDEWSDDREPVMSPTRNSNRPTNRKWA